MTCGRGAEEYLVRADPHDSFPTAMATQRKPSETAKRQEKKRKEKLAAVKQQVEDGSLVIRKMTKKEREMYPPQNRTKKKR